MVARYMAERVTPFRIETADADLEDLLTRLRHTRWAEKETVGDWSQGVPLGYLRELCRYWAEDYDWPARQHRLNELPQYRTDWNEPERGGHFAALEQPALSVEEVRSCFRELRPAR
jgi:epoxide hydrolase